MTTDTTGRVRLAVAALRDRHRRLVMIGAPLALLGVPLILVAGLGWALHDPESSVDQVPAAVVNEDEPVTVDGQLVPLGRELTARLVDHADANYAWTLTSAADAADGLDSGRYRVVVTIPHDFSAAATSPQHGPSAARAAVITVTPAKDAPLTDAVVGRRLVDQTRATLGREVTRTYLENVYIGLSAMHAKMSTAVDGAAQLDDGAGQLAGGASQLASGAGSLTSGLNQLSTGAATLATGSAKVAAGARRLHSGATELAAGADRVSAGNRQLATTVDPVADKVVAVIDAAPDPAVTAGRLEQAADDCSAKGGDPTFCARLRTLAGEASRQAGQIRATLHTTRDRVIQVRAGVDRLAAGSQQVATGAHRLADGSAQVAAGASRVAAGAGELHRGTLTAAAGSRELSAGAQRLSSGASSLASGAGRLHDGLAAAQKQIPTYTAAERTRLATVVSDPITAAEHGFDHFTRQSMTLFAVIALWVAAMTASGLFPAVPATVLRSYRPTWRLALTGAAEPGLLGAAAAVLVGLVVAVTVGAGPARGSLLVLAALATAGTFHLLIRAAAATAPRYWWPAAVTVLGLAFATSLTSAQPPLLQTLAGFLPTAAGTTAIRAATEGSATAGVRAALLLLAWFAVGLVVATVQTERARTTSVRELALSARLRQPVRA